MGEGARARTSNHGAVSLLERAQGMDARASERGGRLARRNVASVLADVFGRVDVGVDARRRDGDADRVDRDDGPSGRGVEGVRTFASSTTNSSAGAMKTSETTSSAAEARAETTVDDGLNLSQGARRNDSVHALSPAVRFETGGKRETGAS